MRIDSITTLPSQILNCIYENIIVVDRDIRLKYYNQSFENLFLLHTQDILTLENQFLDDIFPVQMKKISQIAIKCIDEIVVVQDMLELPVTSSIQNYKHVHYYRIVAIPNTVDKENKEAIIILNNITDYELKRMELNQHLSFLSNLEKRMPIGVFMLDYEDKNPVITLWNPMMEKYFGVKEKDIMGKTLKAFFPSEMIARFTSAIEVVNSSGLYFDLPSEEIITPEGIRSFHVIMTPIKDSKLSSYSYLCLLEDITEIVLKEAQLKETQEQLEASLAQTSFLLEQTDAEITSILKSTINVCIFSLDRDMKYRFFNSFHEKQMIERFGIRVNKGKTADWISQSSQGAGLPIKTYIDKALKGEPQSRQVHFYDKNGRLIYMEAVFSPLNDNNQITGVTVLLFDITEQKHTEEKAEIFEFVSDNAEYGVILIDRDFTVNYINPYWDSQFGLPSKGIIGNPVEILFPRDQRNDILNSLKMTLAENVQSRLQANLKDRKGESVSIILNLVPYGDLLNQGGGIAITCIDVSALEQAKESLILARDNAEKASVQKSTFVANMSHEFRTPLNAILGFSSLLKGEIQDSVLQNHLDSIISSSTVLKNLVNQVLDFSKIEAGKMEIQRTRVNTQDFFMEIFRIFRLQFQEKNIDFEIFSNGPIPNYLFFDQLRLQQVLINLINNSFKFTKFGCVKVVLKYLADRELLLMNIEDSGIGIAREDQDSVFESFEQMEKEDTRNYEGTGLGLTITKKIVKLMNGSIRLKSDIGAGCCFALKIPMSKDNDSVSAPIKYHEPLTAERNLCCYVEKTFLTPIMVKFGKKMRVNFLPFDGVHEFQDKECVKILDVESKAQFKTDCTLIKVFREFNDYNQITECGPYCLSLVMPELKRLYCIYGILIKEDGKLSNKTIDFSVLDEEEQALLNRTVDLKIFSEIEDILPILAKCEDDTHSYSEQVKQAISVFDIQKLEGILDELAKNLVIQE